MLAHIKNDFPTLQQQVRGQRLAYLDNGATTQVPQAVIDAYTTYYSQLNANIRRGIHSLSEKNDQFYDATRLLVASFIGATSANSIVFTSGATEALNLVAYGYGLDHLKPGDEILLSVMEHHSNLLPWQYVAKKTGAQLKYAPLIDDGSLDIDRFHQSLTNKTKLIALTHVSNVTGIINPIATICKMARQRGIITVIDGTQAVPHMAVDVQILDCDFYAFSAHKMYGPKGVGVLFGRSEVLEKMCPYHLGGGIITKVEKYHTEFQNAPQRFEAGTPNISGVYALNACIQYLNNIGYDAIAAHEKTLYEYTAKQLKNLKGLTLYGDVATKAPVFAFNIDQIHPHDIATIADTEGVALRSGMHCVALLHDFFNISATCRGSIAIYNTTEDIDQLINALQTVITTMRRS